MKNLNVVLVSDLGQLDSMQDDWQTLLNKSRNATCFLTFAWIKAWIETYILKEHELCIICFYSSSNLIGVSPCYIRKKKKAYGEIKELRYIGNPEAGSDYLDTIVQPKYEKIIAKKLYEFLWKDIKNKWDVIILQEIPCNSLFLMHFINCIEESGKYYTTHADSYCPLISLNGQFDEYFAGLSKKRRKEVLHDKRIIESEKNFNYNVTNDKNVKDAVSEFFLFYKEKKGKDPGKLQSLVEGYMFNSGKDVPVQVNFVRVNDVNVAGLLHLKYEKTLFAFLMVVDKCYNTKVSLGNFLVWKSIKSAFEDGYANYDFLKGDESYKFHWSQKGNRSLKLRLWKNTTRGKCMAISELTRDIGKVVLR